MVIGLLYLAVTVLILISMLHVYWACGGSWGFKVVLPVKNGGQEPVFVPRKIGTLLVAFLLLFGAVLLFIQGIYLQNVQQFTFFTLGCMVCAALFFIRAIGDFKYVGFFKKIKHSQFARNDTWFYSPLCLLIAVMYLFVLI
ncbi:MULTISPECIES: DUF3995 domain-containing protein [unclassified Lysinibacillus]|uniref:DUF3995 domain-containing protein n=1 Tax=unclassified Lysinibacillus TaxID=2636778 RepID=UPI003819BD56